MRLGCRYVFLFVLLTFLSTTRGSEAAPIDLTQAAGANGLTTYASTTLLVTETSLVGTLTFNADDALGILDDEVTAATEILTVASSSAVSVPGIALPSVKVKKVKSKVPEPGTLLLSGLGLGYCAWMARRHRRRQSSQA